MVADCDELTDAAEAVKLVLVEDAATMTEAGTVTAELLLAKVSARPPEGAAAVKPTVQASDPALAIEGVRHDTVLTAGVADSVGGATAVALIFTITFPCGELLTTVRSPAKAFACAEVNCSVKVAVWPGFKVAGTVIPIAVNDAPVIEMAEIATGAVPVELSVKD